MSSKYVDTTATIQIIGSVFNNPNLLDYDEKYSFSEEDFEDNFHKIVFGTIYKLYELGAQKITLESIEDFLSTRPKSNEIYQKSNGSEWLLKIAETSLPDSFDYYYIRLKKFSLLRAYDKIGLDLNDLYDPSNIFDVKKRQYQEEWLDSVSLEDISLKIDEKIDAIKSKFIDNTYGEAVQAGENIEDLIERLKETPEVGIPLYGSLINTITRGARLKKFYLMSAPTGFGKTRSLVANACNFACNEIYDNTYGWIKNGTKEPTLYITTEQELEEVQTLMLAFLSNVNEEHILNGTYQEDEEERVLKAAQIIKESPLYIELLPDFSLQDIENKIKKNIRDYDVKYVCHDYIHTSLKILEEITKKSGGIKLREDNILFMLSIRLKDLCNKYGIFIMSATQLNGDYVDSKTPDQNLLRGAKSIADKIDFGEILLPVTEDDNKGLENILASNTFEKPDLKISIYKNRRGRYKGIFLWCTADLGTCRINPMFCTTYNYEIIKIDNLKVIVDDKDDINNFDKE